MCVRESVCSMCVWKNEVRGECSSRICGMRIISYLHYIAYTDSFRCTTDSAKSWLKKGGKRASNLAHRLSPSVQHMHGNASLSGIERGTRRQQDKEKLILDVHLLLLPHTRILPPLRPAF